MVKDTNNTTLNKTMQLRSNSALWTLTEEERIKVAESAHTSVNALKELAHDDSLYVRYSVAENSKTPPEILFELAKHLIAQNKNCPAKLLEDISHTTDPDILEAISIHPSASANLAHVCAERLRKIMRTKRY